MLDDEPQVSDEAAALARQFNRGVLDQMARDLGIDAPEAVATKGELAMGIITMRGMQKAMAAPDASGLARPV